MKGSPKRASNSPRPSARTVIRLDLPTVRKMLPLVQRIVADLLTAEQHVGSLLWELEGLDRNRRNLTWPERQRRYFVQDEIAHAKDRRRELEGELEHLGVTVTDAVHGRVGFPTIVNDKQAFFSWQPGEDEIGFWHFAGDADRRRPIPPSWVLDTPIPAATKRRRSSGL
jgi:hypothetical protein